jgi:sensor c-di-GMP phosphodiesterase-like protein
MYAAKAAHTGIEVYAAERDTYSPRRLALVGALKAAIQRRDLTVAYQPKAQLPGGQVVGVEALVRWQDPTHGLVPPDEFIPIAETTGLIAPSAATCWRPRSRRPGSGTTRACRLRSR